MNTTKIVSLVALTAALGGCANAIDTSSAEVQQPAETKAAAAPASGVALTIEQAESALDVGRDPVKARAMLETALRDPAATVEERDEATLALSRALEASGDKERAIRSIEELMRSHGDDHRWTMEKAVSERLRQLVTGQAAHAERLDPGEETPAPPIADALTRYFTPQPDGTTVVNVMTFHGSSTDSSKRGTWNISGALKAQRRDACPLCDDTAAIHTHQSGEGSWTAIPKYGPKLQSALAVFYFDLVDGRIPARYDAELPMPSAEIAARLEKGEGLIVAKERPGSPPSIVIAAPREAQLGIVEDVLASMKSLPLEPVSVPIPLGLHPAEIQSVVRAVGFTKYRACQKALLKTTPGASGRADLAFTIRDDGKVEGAAMADSATLRDPAFVTCMIDATSALTFAASGKSSTVKYPILMTP